MKHGMLFSRHFVFGLLIASGITGTSAQKVVRDPDTAAPLPGKFAWAQAEAKKRGFESGYWVGYSIQRQMSEHSYIGSFYSDPRRNRPSLSELVTGARQLDIRSDGISGDDNDNDVVTNDDDGRGSGRKVAKEVGILLRFSGKPSIEPDKIKISSLSLRVDFEDAPLLWLGGAADGESIDFLKARFSASQWTEVKKELVRAIGLHEPSPAVFTFLRDLLTSKETGSVREESAFWLGQLNTDEALGALMHAAETDASEKVKEQAVFGISQMEGNRGLEGLIKLAKESPEREVGKKAAFWLGQRASEKAISTLKDIVYSSKDTELQKNALFALTQCSNGGAVEDVIKIATTHPNPKIRKEAIFWLGQSEDKRAVEALIDIVRH